MALMLRVVSAFGRSTNLYTVMYGRRATMEMDVNYLLHRQQMSLMRAQSSRSQKGRNAYENLAQSYTDRIDAHRRENEQLIIRAH
jgi:hypothetical protein